MLADLQPTSTAELQGLRRTLEDGHGFDQVIRGRVDEAVATADIESDQRAFQRNLMLSMAGACADAINANTQSPIERLFARALVLRFVGRDGLGLLVHPVDGDAQKEVGEFRGILTHFRAVARAFGAGRSAELRWFLHDHMTRAELPYERRQKLLWLLMKYHHAPLASCIHLTFQPRFVDIKKGVALVRPDMFFWSSTNAGINVIVECDGYRFHASPDCFKRDRQRDRAFKYLGYDVLRFAGSEICDDPVAAADELADYLQRL